MTGRPEHPQLSEGDFWALQAAGDWSLPFELIEGEPVVIPLLSEAGLAARFEVRWFLRRWQQHRGDDGLVVTAMPVALADGTWLLPDLAYWSWDRLPQQLCVSGEPTPDLVVFVKRRGTPDSYESRRRELAREAGVKDAWTVEPERLRIHSARQGVRIGEDMVVSPALPGFHMSAWQAFLTRPDSPARQETQFKHLAVVMAEHPDIRTAVLIGSVARDDPSAHTDVDLLLDLPDAVLGEHLQLRLGIEDATGLDAHFVPLSWAMAEHAGLIAEAVEQGIALLDLDGTWEAIRADRERWRALAQQQKAELDAAVRKAFEHFSDNEGGDLSA